MTTTVLPARGAPAATTGGQVLLAHVEGDAVFAQSLEFWPQAGEVRVQEAATFGPMSSTSTSRSSLAPTTSSSEANPARTGRAAAVARHGDRQADEGAAQADGAAVVDRFDHPGGGNLTDAIEFEQLLLGDGVEVRRALQKARLSETFDPFLPDGVDVDGGT
nr:hypothetical protein [Nocardia tengchongensis]